MNSKKILNSILMLVFSIVTMSCSNNDDNSTTPTPNPGTSLGSFAGNIQVSDDPQTKLGYIYNTVVTITASGTNATIKITGNEGFNREYSGNIVSTGGGVANISLVKQTKPVDKSATGSFVILNNALSLDINYLSDAIIVKQAPTSNSTTTISGKIRMLGTNLIKQ